MYSTKLIQIIKKLSVWEQKSLRQYLHADFFNQREDVIALLDLIIAAEKGTTSVLSKEAIFQQIHPNKPYDAAELYRINNRLLKLVEQFLAIRKVLEDPLQLELQLAKAYRDMGHETGFKATMKRIDKKIEKQPIRNADYLRYRYDIAYGIYDYIGSQVRAGDTNLQEVGDTLDAFFIASKLKQACLMHAHQMVYKKAYRDALLEQVLTYVEQYPTSFEQPAIAIYYNIYKGITGEAGEDYFQKMREIIAQHQHAFEPTEIRDFYLLAINYCIRRLNTGQEYYARASFELYSAGLQQGFLLENNVISKFTFSNTVAAALKLNKYRWAENFIITFRKKLPPKQRESTVLFNLARLHFDEGDYETAMQYLVHFQSEDYINTLLARTMLLKMYYELGEWDALDSLLASMRTYLQRKDVLNYHRTHFQNIINFTKRLMDLKPRDAVAKNKLQAAIETSKFQSEKAWLLEQLASVK